jgi:sugar lactone lactonase YvrE
VPEIYVLTAALTSLGENPVWDVEEQRLYWIGVFEGTVFSSRADGSEVRVSKFPGPLSSLALRADGGAIVTSGTGIYLFDLDTGESEAIFDAGGGPTMSLNDCAIDRQGRRIVTGTADRTLIEPRPSDVPGRIDPPGRLFRVESNLSVQPFAGGIGITNGPCFSLDGASLYCNDSWARCVYAYDYDAGSGEASNRRVMTAFEGPQAVPDGATVDAEGYVWVAAYHAGEVRRYAPDGTLDRRLAMPVGDPTSVAFGGSDLDVLFVTSSGHTDLPGGAGPATPIAGTILAVRGLGVRGVPEVRFAG